LLGDSVITTIAERIDVTPAQVILSWAVRHGISVIPKSESVERQKKNIEASRCDRT
jgi:diketogulonate reductase-like aldo/keto reductase